MRPSAPSAGELAGWVIDAATRAWQLVADLDADQLAVPLLPTVNPPLWEVGHLAWFQEKTVLRDACGEAPALESADALYDGAAVPHDTRWRLDLPPVAVIAAYARTVAERVAEEVTRPDATDVVRHLARRTVHHYDARAEALTSARQTLGYPPPFLPGLSGAEPPAGHAGALSGDAEFAGGRFLLGARMSEPFVHEAEEWAHVVEVAPFAMARAAVTQAEYAEFVEAGGYSDARLWPDGGAWLATTGATRPRYWRGGRGGWRRRHFDTWVDLEPHLPVSHLSWWEAAAYCRWAGRRLPGEAEWEFAAAGGAPDRPRYPWGDEPPAAKTGVTDWRSSGPVDVGACAAGEGPGGCRQLIGNVWEWTASDFAAYPNAGPGAPAASPGRFPGGRRTLRGGGWATRGRHVRSTMRDGLAPGRWDVAAGFRTCAVTAPADAPT
ncbi:SUMF1/EgtB/PvdO family nonheme iron enzyme [Actinomadura graeca]|uniref:SUMF1/EgtB/PvdO family nonheme iron enzyme n=1 Tax=Actinomadura graeca TaxID=2750812 RepID=UPI001E5684C2|nr:SUMF1/EgtB/PvdO family nonheme iron enzyme [Actinomadura graeca]